MSALKTKTNAADALAVISAVALTSFVIAMLYFARDILIPLALAALLTFLLAPLVTRLERWLGRIIAVLLVVTMIFVATGAVGWVLTRQVIDLATKLPDYKENIVAKLQAFRLPQGNQFSAFSKTVEELKKELPGGSAEQNKPSVPPALGKASAADTPELEAAPAVPAVPVKVVEPSMDDPATLMQSMIAPVLGPLGTAALVLLLVIFMLLQREDLRNRLIRLVGQGYISATTRAMDDAGQRVSRYLLMQLVINVTYGIPVAVGLYFIGVPNAILWGGFAVVLRFIPYVGPWIAATIPIFLSLAVSASWWTPVFTISLFIVLELLSNNVMEPWLYGSSTGVSPIALIIAAVFWTWLWGAVGLILATPLTVCLVVMGRHVPRLAFLSVALSDEEALTPAEDCYHRMLTPGDRDELELVETFLKTNSLTTLYDSVFIPVLTTAETDARAELLDQDQLSNVRQSMRDIVEDLGTRPVEPLKATGDKAVTEVAPPPPMIATDCRVYCLPARADRDELAGAMLVQLARQQGFGAQNAAAKLVTGELLTLVEKADVDVICISVVAPSTVIHARYLCLKLRPLLPGMKIIVGLWNAIEDIAGASKRLRDSGADEVVTTLAGALVQMVRLAPAMNGEMTPAPIPADEEERLAALLELNLLDTAAEPVFDRITAKLARVFEMPVVLISLVDRDRQFFKSQTGLPTELARARQTARNVSVCGHVVLKNQIMIVEDLARDRRFANNPLLKEHGFRFYAGVPLLAPNGQPIGSLCLMDMKPRQLTDREQRLLKEYANEVMEEIAKRAPQARSDDVPVAS
jgi:predicted PurR-regulated permease PerM